MGAGLSYANSFLCCHVTMAAQEGKHVLHLCTVVTLEYSHKRTLTPAKGNVEEGKQRDFFVSIMSEDCV